MSDPLTRAEIEDVLSSIRRLVAEGARAPAAPQPASDAPGAAGRLVLTPAQRVAAPSPPAADPTATIREAARRLAEAQAVAHPAAEVPAAGAGGGAGLASLEETIAELEAAVAASGGEWEPDGSEAPPRPPVSGATAARPAPPAPPARPEGAPGPDLPPAGGPASNVHSLTVARRPPAGPAPAPRLPEGLDEAALRDLVAGIVREELQGALGERITRNVRKLVRAEIARALASRQFD